MDKTILMTKHLALYFTTLEIGVGVNYVPQHKELVISFLFLELHIDWLKGE